MNDKKQTASDTEVFVNDRIFTDLNTRLIMNNKS